jgi:hypothetical protein
MRLILFFLLALSSSVFAGGDTTQTRIQPQSEPDFQIHLPHPAKSIKFIMYEKDFTPIQGRISEDKKSVIIRNYLKGSKVRLKVEYEDGTSEEILRSPCYIDPVV